MKKSRWYLYVIPGMIIAFFGLFALGIFLGPEVTSTTPTYTP